MPLRSLDDGLMTDGRADGWGPTVVIGGSTNQIKWGTSKDASTASAGTLSSFPQGAVPACFRLRT